MKIVFLILFIFFSIMFISCKDCSTDNFNNFFTPEETMELNIIADYFDEKVESKCFSNDIEVCYREYCNKLFTDSKAGNITIDTFGLNKIMELKVCNIVWIKSKGKVRKNQEDILSRKLFLQYNFKGKYFEFLKLNSNKNDIINMYFDSIKQVGDIGPTSFSIIISNCDKINFNDESIRLIYAIHWITYCYNYL